MFKSLVYSATTDDRKREKEERNQKIIDLYLKAENTQEHIAEVLNVPQKTISDLINLSGNSTSGNFAKDFKPILYTIWSTPKGDDNTNHFGAFPAIFMENLLQYHTQPLDAALGKIGSVLSTNSPFWWTFFGIITSEKCPKTVFPDTF